MTSAPTTDSPSVSARPQGRGVVRTARCLRVASCPAPFPHRSQRCAYAQVGCLVSDEPSSPPKHRGSIPARHCSGSSRRTATLPALRRRAQLRHHGRGLPGADVVGLPAPRGGPHCGGDDIRQYPDIAPLFPPFVGGAHCGGTRTMEGAVATLSSRPSGRAPLRRLGVATGSATSGLSPSVRTADQTGLVATPS